MREAQKAKLIHGLWFVIPLLLTLLLLLTLVPPAESLLTRTGYGAKAAQKEALHFVAIGDSLTEGIGDTTGGGGYVPLLKKDLMAEAQIDALTAYNFGKAGNRTDQLLKRIKETKEIKLALQRADFITLTIGGNDLMKTVRSEILNDLKIETFSQPLADYQENLRAVLAELRSYAPETPIYLLGIYNPFYLSFQEVVEMQEVVDLWNRGSEAVIKETPGTYFIPINDSLYRGRDGQVGIGDPATDTSAATTLNNLISAEDNFHPNNLGYQIMANAFKEQIIKTKTAWLEK